MKISNGIGQRRIVVDTRFYAEDELTALIEEGIIKVLDKSFKEIELSDLDFMYTDFNKLDDYILAALVLKNEGLAYRMCGEKDCK